MPKFSEWVYNEDKKSVRVTKFARSKPKKFTGSRFGAVVGLNHWKSPFGAWCEACRVAEEPFEGNKYTEAGYAIEPKLIDFCKTSVSPYIKDPKEYYGARYSDVRYDFYPYEDIFGGMWDAIGFNARGDIDFVIEAKTTSRPQDWEDGVPDSYAVQGLLYACLLGVDDVYFPVAFLESSDYDNPTSFVCTDKNTRIYHLSVMNSRVQGKSVHDYMAIAEKFWVDHVKTGMSPEFDEKKDKVFLDIMRTNDVSYKDDVILKTMVDKVAVLESEVTALINTYKMPDYVEDMIKEKEKECKNLKDRIKCVLQDNIGDDDTYAVAYNWKLTKSNKESVDTDRMKADGVYEKYCTIVPSYRLTQSKEK